MKTLTLVTDSCSHFINGPFKTCPRGRRIDLGDWDVALPCRETRLHPANYRLPPDRREARVFEEALCNSAASGERGGVSCRREVRGCGSHPVQVLVQDPANSTDIQAACLSQVLTPGPRRPLSYQTQHHFNTFGDAYTVTAAGHLCGSTAAMKKATIETMMSQCQTITNVGQSPSA
ncbi:hypothetical protein HaLaN_02667, partial [Haematococcus lacustris]